MAVALVALIGCSGTAGGSTAPSSGSAAAPSTAATAAEPSAAAPSEAAPSAAASEPVTAFAFPSDDKELEAVIPDKICGATAQKLSLKGKEATGDDDAVVDGDPASPGQVPLGRQRRGRASRPSPVVSVTIIKIEGVLRKASSGSC